MAKKIAKRREWTTEDVKMLKALAREGDEDGGDRAQAQANRGGDASEGAKPRRVVGWREDLIKS